MITYSSEGVSKAMILFAKTKSTNAAMLQEQDGGDWDLGGCFSTYIDRDSL
jgi:hypothetical protein